ncbi:MAG: trypsin-like peptidase domain-containing protein [Saprospiraceae bacterium]|nr:trypsin-like peptidase domain-containing protein [Saprospiraceae bacterium]
MKNTLVVVLSSLLSAVLAIAAYKYFEEPVTVIIREGTNVSPTYAAIDENHTDPEWNRALGSYPSAAPTDFTEAAGRVTQAVVNIKSQTASRLDFWGKAGSYESSSGSGVIISNDGFIVTNYHVVEDYDSFEVTLADNREMQAQLIGTDPTTDLALLKIEAQNLPHLTFGNSDSLLVGEWVLAVGNPFNLASTVTAGIVSAKGRNIDILEGAYKIESFIQTDAVVNPGNSGGALVNTRGDLVGINTAIITRSGQYEGYSFAVPAALVEKVIRDLREFGIVQRGILGVGIDELTPRHAENLGLESLEGVYITRVSPESGADEAGLQRGDVVIGINGIPTRSVPELQEIVARFRPGDILNVSYLREGRNGSTDVVLKNQYNDTELAVKQVGETLLRDLGFELRNLNREEIRKVGQIGVYVASIYRGSKIYQTRMDIGYVITHVNDKRVYSVEDVINIIESADGEVIFTGFYEGMDEKENYYYQFMK